MAKKQERALHKVEDDLVYLYSLKSDQIGKKKERDDKYAQCLKQNMDPYKSHYSTNAIFSVIQGKMADIAAGIQEYDFLPEDDAAEKNINVVKSAWKYEWLTTGTDDNIYKAFLSALKHWDGYIYEWTRRIIRDVKCPVGVDENWKTEWATEKKVDWDGIYQEFIPMDEIMHDGSSIDNANKVAWIKHWNRTDFIDSYKNNPNYKNVNEDLPLGRHYYIADSKMQVNGNIQDDDVISELRLYNKAEDSLIILAN